MGVLTAFKLNWQAERLMKMSLPQLIQVDQGETQRMKEVRLEQLVKQNRGEDKNVRQ